MANCPMLFVPSAAEPLGNCSRQMGSYAPLVVAKDSVAGRTGASPTQDEDLAESSHVH